MINTHTHPQRPNPRIMSNSDVSNSDNEDNAAVFDGKANEAGNDSDHDPDREGKTDSENEGDDSTNVDDHEYSVLTTIQSTERPGQLPRVDLVAENGDKFRYRGHQRQLYKRFHTAIVTTSYEELDTPGYVTYLATDIHLIISPMDPDENPPPSLQQSRRSTATRTSSCSSLQTSQTR